MEEVRPLLKIRFDTTGEWLHTILSIPFGQMIEEVRHRLVEFDIIGVHVAVDVLVPALHTLRQSPHRDGVACLLRQILIAEAVACPHTVFRHPSHHVLAQLVVGVQEHIHLHHHQRLRRDVLHRCCDMLALTVFLLVLLTIGILKHFPHHIGVLAKRETEHRQPLSHCHCQTRLLTITCQPRENQMGTPFFLCDAHRVVVGF